MRPATVNCSRIRLALPLILAITVLCALQLHASPQPSTPIRKIYVEPFQGKFGSAQLRERVIESLRTNGKFQLVEKPADADAVVHGTGEIWVEGYVANRPHSSAREAEYTGYLSLAVQNLSGETLWSYLVTPAHTSPNVTQEMAEHIVRLMSAALAHGSTHSPPATTISTSQVTLTGAGSTFSAPLYQQWIESYLAQHPQMRITYQPIGSEQGIDLLQAGKVDFAASDIPLSDEQMARMQVKFDTIATALGGVVPAYNLPGVASDLRFTPKALAEIYLGEITNWNDPALRAINRRDLPDKPIVVIQRSDGSGTTFAWTTFLSATSAEWKSSVGSGMRVNWPTGQSAQGNDGVAAKVAETPGAIGYVELTYAIRFKLSYGLIRNPSGKFVQANLATLSEAAKSAPKSGDLRSPLLNTDGGDAYPITTFTWILLPTSTPDPKKSAALHDLLQWMLTSGQKECSALGYLPLPKEVADQQLRKSSSP